MIPEEFATWEDGKAPWGCYWFQEWSALVDGCIAKSQKPVVVYKKPRDWKGYNGGGCPNKGQAHHNLDGVRWDVEGLGNSQRGEVAYLRENNKGLELEHLEVSNYQQLVTLSKLQMDLNDGRFDDAAA